MNRLRSLLAKIAAPFSELPPNNDALLAEHELLRAERDQLLSERDGYRSSYLAVQEDIGELRRLVDDHRQVYDALICEIRTPSSPDEPVGKVNASGHFLMLSNGRTGSTWLLSSLNQLPDVRGWNEIKWKSPAHRAHRAEFLIDHRTQSMKAVIGAACHDPRYTPVLVAGSKLVLDPYWFLGPPIFADLARMIEPDIHLIHLRRRYLDAWLSWKVRGVYHRMNATRAAELNIKPWEIPEMDPPELTPLVLMLNGQPLKMADGRPYSIRTAIDDMLAAFTNDLQILELIGSRSGSISIDYAEIPTRLVQAVQLIGSNASTDELAAVIANPLTEKLEDLAGYVTPIDPLGALSAVLDQAIKDAAAGNSPAWRFEGNFLLLSLPTFAALLRDWGLTDEVDGENVRWPLRKPLLNA